MHVVLFVTHAQIWHGHACRLNMQEHMCQISEMVDILTGVEKPIIFEYEQFNHPELNWGELYLFCELHDNIAFEHESCPNVVTKQFQLKL